jgi:hypothetical protein
VALTLTRYNSSSDFAFAAQLSNFTVVYNGTTVGPVSLAFIYDDSNGTRSYGYQVNGSAIVGSPTVTVSGNTVTIGTGTARANYGGGWVQIAYAGWVFDATTGQPSAGTATVTGSNGDTAVINVVPGSYSVVLTVNGATSSYSVAA